MKNEPGKLYVVATPIGNMGDITLRAKETLKNVDFVACEDTRNTGKLLSLLGIKNKLVSLHQHSRDESIEKVLSNIISGQDAAYVSDAGTPAISDPGQKLIQAIRSRHSERVAKNLVTKRDPSSQVPQDDGEKGIEIIPVPGPSAVTAAVSVSGLVNKEFYFAGFLPKKKGRQTKLKELAKLEVPIVIYENALRLEKTLNNIKEYFGTNVEVFIAREMTKMFEEYWGGKIEEVLEDLENHKLKGEITLIVKR